MKDTHPIGPPTGMDVHAHKRLANQLQNLLKSPGAVETRELLSVIHSLFREVEAVQKRLDLLPEEQGLSLHRWFWQPMRQESRPSPSQSKVYVFCLADTHAHVRDGQALITMARHLSFGDAPAVQFEPIPVWAGKQEVPQVLQGVFPTVALLVGRPALFGSLMRQYFVQRAANQRFTFTRDDPEAPDQGLRDEHFGDTFVQRRFDEEGESLSEDYGLVRRFSFEDGPTSRTFYVIAGLSSLGTYAATLCSLFLLDQLNRDLPGQPVEAAQLDVVVNATATFGQPFWKLDASNVRIVRAYLNDLVYQADLGTTWQAVPPREIELVLRGPARGGVLDIDHVVLEKLQREVLKGEQQQARIIGCLIHRSLGDDPEGVTGAGLAEQKWIWQDRGRNRKIGPSEAISKMLNVARRHLGSALISRENRYFVKVPGQMLVREG